MSFLAPFFKTLRLPECRIAFVDPLFGRAFSNVVELNVSRNLLQVLENLPPALRVLNASANAVDAVASGAALRTAQDADADARAACAEQLLTNPAVIDAHARLAASRAAVRARGASGALHFLALGHNRLPGRELAGPSTNFCAQHT